ncbi:hypothetical protein [Paenibacillus eucommiae]|uniref:Lipoprotein n=1 Tax=Paenibacillus eucommiae TaxID=1355755 RepID=A0ABS4IYZ5_9BACL|nr:hypothetical protein [Paenibacillus eucommiae]MBP1992814.1 hypothetical protein [Paenibacillus eucommiae]
MRKKWLSLSLAAVVSISMLTACTDNAKIKETVENSLAKQNEMKSYNFEGSAQLQLSEGLLSSTNPLVGGLLSLVRESTVDWKGAVSDEPLQMELDLKLTPKGTTSSIAIPTLIKDSKLYFNMPAINKPDEYYSVDLKQMSQDSKSPLNLDTLKNTPQVTTALLKLFVSGLDAKWFEEAKKPAKLTDGTSAKTITIEITKKNEEKVSALFQSKLPEFVQTLQTNGLLTADQADKLTKGQEAAKLTIQAPGKLVMLIDEQGFIRDQTLDLIFSVTNAGGQASSNQLLLHQTVDGINQPPVFTKEIPKNVKNFDDLLKLFKGTAGNAKQ